MTKQSKREVERERVLKTIEDPMATSEQRREAIRLAINRYGLNFEGVIDLANSAEHRKCHDATRKTMTRGVKRHDQSYKS